MKVIILGAGQVGETIASYLVFQKHEVSMIDHDQEVLKKLSNRLDIQTICGQASHPDVLAKAGANSADMLIAVTHFDEVNMVSCQIAFSLFGIKKKIARIRHKSYLRPFQENLLVSSSLSIDVVISPEEEVAKSIARSLSINGSFDVISLCKGRLIFLATHCAAQSPVINTPIRHIMAISPSIFIIIAVIIRDGEVFIPQDTDNILKGDEIYFLTHLENVKAAMALFGHQSLNNNHLVVLGGGKIGLGLAEEIRHSWPMDIRFVELSQKNAEILATRVPECLVLKGDALDAEILAEAAVNKSEAVICVTNNDKTNILAAILAKQYGAQRIMVLINDNHYLPLIHSVGVHSIINPQTITVSKIIQHLRQRKIRSLYSIRNRFGEIIEVEIENSSLIIGMTVESIQKSLGILILVIMRNNHVFSPSLTMSLEVDDTIVLFSKLETVSEVEDFFLSFRTVLKMDRFHYLKSLTTFNQFFYPHSGAHILKTTSNHNPSFIKRDDELGGLFNGSKVRKYYSLIPSLIDKNIKIALLKGGVYSNAIATLVPLLIEKNIKPILFLRGEATSPIEGNFFYLKMFQQCCDIYWISRKEWSTVDHQMNEYVHRYSSQKTIIIPEGACCLESLLGAMTLAVDIIINQQELDLAFDHVFIEAGTGSTAIALILGLGYLESSATIHVLDLTKEADLFQEKLNMFQDYFCSLIKPLAPIANRYCIYKPSIVSSFGSVNTKIIQKITEFTKNEGIILDPIYAAPLLIETPLYSERNNLKGNFLFIHNGGTLSTIGYKKKFSPKNF